MDPEPQDLVARRRWTLLILSGDNDRIRQLELSRDLIRLTVAGCLIVLSLLSSLSVGFFSQGNSHLKAERLAQQNALLEGELETIRIRMSVLQGSLTRLSSQDAHFRLLAGLDPVDKDVLEAGIGGPGTATLRTNPLYHLDEGQARLTFSAAYDLNAMIRRAQILASSWREASDTLSLHIERIASTPSIQPTRGYVSSTFSRSRWHPILERSRPHEGLDISAPKGTPILAAAKGTVLFVGTQGDYGRMVEIDHGHGYVTRYAHASRTLVRSGQRVERGEKIAEVGDTGLAIGPHLHYEVLLNGRAQNPANFIYDREAARD